MNLLQKVEANLLKRTQIIKVPYFKKGDFLKVDRLISREPKRIKSLFGKCVSVKRKGINSSFSLLYNVGNFKVTEKFSIHSPFIKKITVFKKK